MLERHEVALAFSRAWLKTGNSIAAKIAMIAITTRSSMSVKPDFREIRFIWRCPFVYDPVIGPAATVARNLIEVYHAR